MKTRLWNRSLMMIVGFGLISGAAILKAEDDEVDYKDLPKAVQESYEKNVPKAKILEIEKESSDGKTVYEIKAKVDGEVVEYKFSEDGKVLGAEKDDDDDDGKGEHEGHDD